jgi:hypothetical protein
MKKDLRRKPRPDCKDFFKAIEHAGVAVRDYAACATIYRYVGRATSQRQFWLCLIGFPKRVAGFEFVMRIDASTSCRRPFLR